MLQPIDTSPIVSIQERIEQRTIPETVVLTASNPERPQQPDKCLIVELETECGGEQLLLNVTTNDDSLLFMMKVAQGFNEKGKWYRIADCKISA